MKTFQFFFRVFRLCVLLSVCLALQAAPCRGQVTWQQLTNGLVDYYPLNSINPGGYSTPDLVSRRDLTLFGMNSNNIVVDTHPGIESNLVFNFSQAGSGTLLIYQSAGQNPLDGSGDFLPFINQRGATMNFWTKGPVPANQDLRIMAECADNGDNNPFFSLSDQPSTSRTGLGLFLRLNAPTTDTNGVTANQFSDGTYQVPAYYFEWNQAALYTTNTLFDNNWHMFTMEIATNGDVHVFVDGNYDPGVPGTNSVGQTNLDNEGNRAITPPLSVTNFYYTTNNYPGYGSSNPPPNGFVRWMVPGLNQAGAFTAFGGYARNGNIGAGIPCRMSDIGFWNRVLSQDEIRFVMTNGVGLCNEVNCSFCQPHTTSFSANPTTVHPGESVTLQWHIQAITSRPIVSLLLSPTIGEVTNVTDYISGNGSTNLPVFTNTVFELSLTNLNSCGYLQAQLPAYAGVTVISLSFSGMSYLLSDPGNGNNPSFTMTWNSISNHTYTVQRKLSLSDPTWMTLSSGLPSAGDSTSFADYTLGSDSTAFYRITCP